jgi:peptidyl-prolyl cis-trans isomerase SurA
MKSIILISFLIPLALQAKLLDKTLAVINDQIITLSQVKRISSNVDARKNISPQIFNKPSYNNKETVALRIQRILIREKLEEMGYVISDDQVEGQIKSTEKRLGLNRDALLGFLKSNSFTFDEYFELIRETIEFNVFNSRIIHPLISITEQEVKSAFFKKNIDNKMLSIKYSLVDFSLDKGNANSNILKNFTPTLDKFQKTGVMPEAYKNVQVNKLGDVSEEGLTSKLSSALKRTEEGKFSKPVLIGNIYHVFFVSKKNIVESEFYINQKEQIRQHLFVKSMKSISNVWFSNEASKHYIKYFF